MSNILIKDMDMPSSCQPCKLKRFAGNRVLKGCKPEVLYECPFCDGLFALKNERQPSCKLTQLPTPHGRLIDADKVLSEIREIVKADTECGKITFAVDIFRPINNAPTIIEAER